ncbi:MAG: hypothetical protein F6K40_33030 [Okeania sp. SIO3I5]|uniref:hypothetical protein n=1 Tax=Okeania sp. SIO3I5 TaxID=2607805 RepID=UPI0013BDC1E5|nr:hypothetical protein [Okeania sp. SIO3I5]NEQ40785.1 hypothetical protein [Okeania sp. SIO3I5]
MNLSPAYLKWREFVRQEGREEGRQEERKIVLEWFLKIRFGELDYELLEVVGTLLNLSTEEYAEILIQLPNLSREEFLKLIKNGSEDTEFFTNSSPAYIKWREDVKEEGRNEGRQEGRKIVLESLLKSRFGELDQQLLEVVKILLTLSPSRYALIVIQLPNLSREEFFELIINESEDTELMMNILPARLAWHKTLKQEGREEGRIEGKKIVLGSLLKTQFGEIDQELVEAVEILLNLSADEYAQILIQLLNLSREEFLDLIKNKSSKQNN